MTTSEITKRINEIKEKLSQINLKDWQTISELDVLRDTYYDLTTNLKNLEKLLEETSPKEEAAKEEVIKETKLDWETEKLDTKEKLDVK